MANLYLLLIILIYLLKVILTSSFPFSCCTYEQDAFRGFEMKECREASIETHFYEKDQLGNQIIEICHTRFNGIPVNDNFTRLKNDKFEVNKDECIRECKDLVRFLNENYIIKQEKNRLNEAKKLKEKKKKIQEELRIKIDKISTSLTNGKSSLYHRFGTNSNKQMINSFANPKFLINRGNNKLIKNNIKDYNKAANSNIEIEERVNEIVSNCDSFYETEENKEFRLLPPNERIEILELEIMYFEKKNRRPVDFILDRFNIKDSILISLIKIFESTLEEVVTEYRRSLKETIFFQLKILSNYELKINKKI
jgi:hypothetical protein